MVTSLLFQALVSPSPNFEAWPLRLFKEEPFNFGACLRFKSSSKTSSSSSESDSDTIKLEVWASAKKIRENNVGRFFHDRLTSKLKIVVILLQPRVSPLRSGFRTAASAIPVFAAQKHDPTDNAGDEDGQEYSDINDAPFCNESKISIQTTLKSNLLRKSLTTVAFSIH